LPEKKQPVDPYPHEKKRRGRKRIQDDIYFKKAKKRIEAIKERLKTAK
jgi:hypothetical protein